MDNPLDTYMQAREIKDAEFAGLVERDRSLISKLRSGRAKPSLDLAARIEAVTEGEVPMSAWAA